MPYILDSMSASPVAVYALRKLVSGYSGSAIRVREDSGNTEADIGFDANGDLDTSALSSHVGSNSGYIVTWYDQSGNGYNVSQATTTAQFRIVNAGTIDTGSTGKPSVTSHTTANTLFFERLSLGSSYTGTTITGNAVFQMGTANNYSRVMSVSKDLAAPDWNNPQSVVFFQRNNLSNEIITFRGVAKALQTINNNQAYVFTSKHDGTNNILYKDGTASTAVGSTGTFDWNYINVMVEASTITPYYVKQTEVNQKVSEILIFNSALSDDDRRYLETDQADYYSITHADPLYPASGSVDITHVIGEATAEGLAPTIEVPRTVNIVHVIGEAIASGINPTRIGKPTSSGGARLRLGLGLGL